MLTRLYYIFSFHCLILMFSCSLAHGLINITAASMIISEIIAVLKETHFADVADGDVSEGAGGNRCHSWSCWSRSRRGGWGT